MVGIKSKSNMNKATWVAEVSSVRPLFREQSINEESTKAALERCANVFRDKREEYEIKLYLNSIFNLTENEDALTESANTLSLIGKRNAHSAKEVASQLSGIANETKDPYIVKSAARNITAKYMSMEISMREPVAEVVITEAKDILRIVERYTNAKSRELLTERLKRNNNLKGLVRY